MDYPYGDFDRAKGPLRDTVVEDSKIAVRVIALCKKHHALGDAFSIEYCWLTAMLQFESMQELLKMPGVYVFTWDNCAYGETYKHWQVMVTSMPWLAQLAKDCTGDHEHLRIGFGLDLSTKDVSPYSCFFLQSLR